MKRAMLVISLAMAGSAFAQSKQLLNIHERATAVWAQRASSRAEFVAAAVRLADHCLAAAQRDKEWSSGYQDVAAAMLETAAYDARMHLGQPKKALELYKRAQSVLARMDPEAQFDVNPQIADIEEFELNDHAAAAHALEHEEDFWRKTKEHNGGVAPRPWRPHAVEVEMEFLRSGKRFTGDVTEQEAQEFAQFLNHGAQGESGEENPAASLDEATLASRAPSHSNFLLTWQLASRLPSKEAAEGWLQKNDPADFWHASLLTFVAMMERALPPSGYGFGGWIPVYDLIRLRSGQPTAFALLARDYAKTHRIP